MGENVRKTKHELKDELAALRAQMEEIKAMAEEAGGLKGRIESILKEAQDGKKEIENAIKAQDTLLIDINAQLQSSTMQVKEIGDLKASAQAQKNEIDALAASGARIKGEIEEGNRLFSEITGKIKTQQTAFETWDEENRKKFDTVFKKNEESYEFLFSKINSLLPGATSIGLAKSFDERREIYFTPRLIWAITGGISILLIAIISMFQGNNILHVTTWNDFFIVFSKKIPVVLPLAFLGYFAFHQFGILSRIEEEYAHKAALSKSFEGYKGELSELAEKTNDQNLKKLIDQTLDAIALQSANVYDTKSRPVSPVEAGAEKTLDIAMELAKKITPEAAINPFKTGKWAIAGSSGLTALLLILMWLVLKGLGH